MDSGGRAFLNTNNITSDSINEALQETGEYYLLAWRPEEEELRGGKFQSINLEIVIGQTFNYEPEVASSLPMSLPNLQNGTVTQEEAQMR